MEEQSTLFIAFLSLSAHLSSASRIFLVHLEISPGFHTQDRLARISNLIMLVIKWLCGYASLCLIMCQTPDVT
jgi:hypothetical protein